MKFQVRPGFVLHLITHIDLGDGKTERQENSFFGDQRVDLTPEQAELHAHKLEPLDKAAESFLAAKVLPQSPASAISVTPETLALVQAMAAEMAKQIVAAMTPVPQIESIEAT